MSVQLLSSQQILELERTPLGPNSTAVVEDYREKKVVVLVAAAYYDTPKGGARLSRDGHFNVSANPCGSILTNIFKSVIALAILAWFASKFR